MKKLTLLMALVALSLAACSPTTVKQDTKDKAETTVSTETKNADIVKETETIVHEGVEGPGAVEYKTTDDRNTINASTEAPLDVVLFYGLNEAGDGLAQRMDEAQSLEPQVIMDYLLEYSGIDNPIKVLSFEQDGKIGKLDIDKEPTASIDGMAEIAIGNSFIDNYELDTLEIYVNGEPLYTGDNALEYVSKYKVLG